MGGVYAKARHIVGVENWTPINAPSGYNYFGLRNAGPADGLHPEPITIRTTVDDPNTEDEIATGAQEGLIGAMIAVSGWPRQFRFKRGHTIVYAKSSGSFPQILIVTWVR